MEENQMPPMDSSTPNSLPPTPPQEPMTSGARKSKIPILVAIIIVVLAGGAWVAYAAMNSPTRVWQKFEQQALNSPAKMYKGDFNFSYTDNGELTAEQQKANPYAQYLSKLKLAFSGSGYTNITDQSNPTVDENVTYNLSSGSSGFSAGLEIMMKAQTMYVKVGSIPFIGATLSQLNNGEKVDWIKLDFAALQQALNTNTSTPVTLPNLTEQTQAYRNIMEKHWSKLVTIQKTLGSETLRGVSTYHYANTVDKAELKSLAADVINYAVDEASKQPSAKAEDLTQVKTSGQTIFNSIIDHMQVKTFETWVGKSDLQLHKVMFVATMPSLVSVVNHSQDPDLQSATPDPQNIQKMLDRVSYDGEINFSQELYDFGKTVEVTAPTNALDVVKKIQEQKLLDEQAMQAPTTKRTK